MALDLADGGANVSAVVDRTESSHQNELSVFSDETLTDSGLSLGGL